MSHGDLMIELAPTDHEDSDFLSLVQRILNGAIAALEVREVYLVQALLDMSAIEFPWSQQ